MMMVCGKPQAIRSLVTLADDKSQEIRIAMLMVDQEPQGIRTVMRLGRICGGSGALAGVILVHVGGVQGLGEVWPGGG